MNKMIDYIENPLHFCWHCHGYILGADTALVLGICLKSHFLFSDSKDLGQSGENTPLRTV